MFSHSHEDCVYVNSFVYILSNNENLKHYLSEEYIENVSFFLKLNKIYNDSKNLSSTEQYLLYLALHLFGIEGEIDLNSIDYLDLKDQKIAKEALKIRFKM